MRLQMSSQRQCCRTKDWFHSKVFSMVLELSIISVPHQRRTTMDSAFDTHFSSNAYLAAHGGDRTRRTKRKWHATCLYKKPIDMNRSRFFPAAERGALLFQAVKNFLFSQSTIKCAYRSRICRAHAYAQAQATNSGLISSQLSPAFVTVSSDKTSASGNQ